jgi:hypothetical protein
MNGTTPTPDVLATDPKWFPHALDINRRTIQLAWIDRNAIAQEAFLDSRMSASIKGFAEVDVDAIAPHPLGDHKAPVFIFHTAFCCSTLMARALDIPGQTLALKEPNILMDLANAYRMAGDEAARRNIDPVRDLILQLLSRPHQPGEQALIKTTNTANNLAPIFRSMGAKAILLYSDLKGFLVSVLKKGEACKVFVRKQYKIFALDDEGVGAIPERQALGFTDLQIAALVWRHQMEMFSRLLSTFDNHNFSSLDFRILLERPEQTLIAANRNLGLRASETALRDAANGPVFQNNSKFSHQHYNAGARQRDEKILAERYHEELAMIEDWALKLTIVNDIPVQMPKPLL